MFNIIYFKLKKYNILYIKGLKEKSILILYNVQLLDSLCIYLIKKKTMCESHKYSMTFIKANLGLALKMILS